MQNVLIIALLLAIAAVGWLLLGSPEPEAVSEDTPPREAPTRETPAPEVIPADAPPETPSEAPPVPADDTTPVPASFDMDQVTLAALQFADRHEALEALDEEKEEMALSALRNELMRAQGRIVAEGGRSGARLRKILAQLAAHPRAEVGDLLAPALTRVMGREPTLRAMLAADNYSSREKQLALRALGASAETAADHYRLAESTQDPTLRALAIEQLAGALHADQNDRFDEILVEAFDADQAEVRKAAVMVFLERGRKPTPRQARAIADLRRHEKDAELIELLRRLPKP